MKRFVIADTHFGHESIIRYESRPFKSAKEMDERLITLWNSVVGNEDIVYVLGDFTLSRRIPIIKELVDHVCGPGKGDGIFYNIIKLFDEGRGAKKPTTFVYHLHTVPRRYFLVEIINDKEGATK